MKEDYHIDTSNRFYDKKTSGIACVSAVSKSHNGCALSPRLKKYIEKNLCTDKLIRDFARLYSICIYYLIRDKMDLIRELIICNDEEFTYVREYLLKLLEGDNLNPSFKIINITKYREALGRRVSSLADNRARSYAKRGLQPNKWSRGHQLNVVQINYEMVKEKWKIIK